MDQPEGTTDPLAGLSADELLRVLGHEIGNLVTIVSGYGQMLREHWSFLDDEKRLEIVGRINRQVDQLRVLIDNFQHLRWLTVSAQDFGDLPIRADMNELIAGLADDLVPLADDHPLLVDLEPGLPPVCADRASVQHVLMNLVVNATKFSPREAPISIAVKVEGDAVRFSVTDRGPGIPADQRDHVFKKFVRLHEGGVGVGLGLFICRALVEAMGGRIWAEDADDLEDGGARIIFELPVAGDNGQVAED
jgi:signal transduction histidine kinase